MCLLVRNLTLAIDLSSNTGSLAIGDGQFVHDIEVPGRMNHSEELLSTLEQLLHQHSYSLQNLKQILTTKGPGSFTGLRIAFAAAKALALSTGCEIVTLSTSECRSLGFQLPGFVVTGISKDKYLIENWSLAEKPTEPRTLTLEEWKVESTQKESIYLIDSNTAAQTPAGENLILWPCKASFLLYALEKAKSKESFTSAEEQILCSPEYFGTTRFKTVAL
jgi:tRNA threonylcarbamoyl adenosine modification protein YeaZ